MKIIPKFVSIKNHPLFYWVVLGIILRYVLVLYTSWPYDAPIWYKTSLNIIYGNGIYGRCFFSYPPVWGYIMAFFIFIGSLFIDPKSFAKHSPSLQGLLGIGDQMITSPQFHFFYKTPIFISDLIIAYILYRIVISETKDINKAKQAFLMWFLNPLVLFINCIAGQFSSICVLFLMLSLLFLIKWRFFISGIMLMLGIMTKVFPAYFIPLITGLIISMSYNQNNMNKKLKAFINISSFFVGLFLSALIILLPIIINRELTNFFWSVVGVRKTLSAGVGGFSLWFIQYIPYFSWIKEWQQNHPFTTLLSQHILILISLSIVFLLSNFYGYRNPLKCLVSGAMASLTSLYLFTPLIQAQYLIWIFPLLIIAALVYNKPYSPLLNVLTYSGLLFNLSISGFWIVLLPLCEFSNILKSEDIISISKSYLAFPGLVNRLLREDLWMISTFLGVIAILILFISSFKNLKKKNV